MIESSTTTTIDSSNDDRRYLRRYLRVLRVDLSTDMARVLARTTVAAIRIMDGSQPSNQFARAHALIAWVLFTRVSDLARTPAWTDDAKRLAKALRIAAQVLDANCASAPASLNDVLEAYPRTSAVTLERLWRDGQHLLETVDLIIDETQERINLAARS